jgi:hypothetical protein
MLLVIGLWMLAGPHKPSDSDIEGRFATHRAELEQIVGMMETDKQMSRIANDFLWKQDNAGWPRPESEWGITRARWNSYKELFRKVGSENGAVRAEKSSDVEIMIHSWGIVPSGGSISFIHCGNPVDGFEDTAIPCSAKAKENEGSKDNTSGDAYRFKRLDQDWFIYEKSY